MRLQAIDPLALSEIPIRDLPLYSCAQDTDFSPAARAFKQAIAEVDAGLFVTPEYSRSIPGALKNAIDWARSLGGAEPLRPAVEALYHASNLNAARRTRGYVRWMPQSRSTVALSATQPSR